MSSWSIVVAAVRNTLPPLLIRLELPRLVEETMNNSSRGILDLRDFPHEYICANDQCDAGWNRQPRLGGADSGRNDYGND